MMLGHHQGVVAGHLEYHRDRSHGGAGSASDDRRHPDDGGARDVDAGLRRKRGGRRADARPKGRAHEQGRRKNAARGSRSEADRRRIELCDEQNGEQQRRRQAAFQDRFDRRVAHALDEVMSGGLMQNVNEDADRQHPDGMSQVRIANAVEPVARGFDAENEGCAGEARERAEQGVNQQRFDRRLLVEQQALRHLEGRVPTEEHLAHEGRGSRGERDRQKRPRAHLGQHQFDGEQDAADRGVERGRNAGACPGGDERDALPTRHGNDLPERRGERRPDLDDRPFASDGRARADRDRRGQGLDDRHDRPNYAFVVMDRVHHFRNPVSPSLGREVDDQERDAKRADHRNQDDERAPGARRREQIGVVGDRQPSFEGEIVNEADQVAEDHRAGPSEDSDDQSQHGQTGQSIAERQLDFHVPD